MTIAKTAKIAGATLIAIAMTGGVAYAGAGKDCDGEKHAKMQTDAKATSTAVLDASADAVPVKAEKKMKTLTFDEAVALCTEKGAKDLQACVDYKTGVKAKPRS